MQQELKNCPFCGASGIVCGAAPSHMRVYCSNDNCPMDDSWRKDNEKMAIERWNTRTSPIHPTAEPVEDMGEFEKVRHALRVACVKAKDTTTVEQTYVPALKALDELQARARLTQAGE